MQPRRRLRPSPLRPSSLRRSPLRPSPLRPPSLVAIHAVMAVSPSIASASIAPPSMSLRPSPLRLPSLVVLHAVQTMSTVIASWRRWYILALSYHTVKRFPIRLHAQALSAMALRTLHPQGLRETAREPLVCAPFAIDMRLRHNHATPPYTCSNARRRSDAQLTVRTHWMKKRNILRNDGFSQTL